MTETSDPVRSELKPTNVVLLTGCEHGHGVAYDMGFLFGCMKGVSNVREKMSFLRLRTSCGADPISMGKHERR